MTTIDQRTDRIPGVWSADLTVHSDERGEFVEWYRSSRFTANTGVAFSIAQANMSISARGVIRGIHYFADDDGQAKYVTCASGEALDIAVDLRLGSPTFGHWTATPMSPREPRAVFLPRGIGHAFVALSDGAVMQYLCDREYVPGAERTIHPLDVDLALPWPADLPPIISERDRTAPTLRQARERDLLPRF
ncbi:dTDP-4-dehydrorhamnose 3,5-epimerase [Actinokineospora sp.]|uniref:dTDP-4-dehydrorhamnose 3,5-epimerase n=1 Tax=Actinokineospora sp. TaxID=1872133 RepID=UPI004037FA3F